MTTEQFEFVMAIGCYFTFTVWYAVSSENYFTVPFLLLFVFGYWYTGLLSLLQGRFERFNNRANANSNSDDLREKPYPVGI